MLKLDRPSELAALDSGHMLNFLRRLPEVAAAAFARGRSATLPLAAPTRLLICGMGGSAISGDLIRTQLLHTAPFPVVVHRGDRLPVFADKTTLAIFMSYSGETRETLACLREAISRGVPGLLVSSGGTATALATAAGWPVVGVEAGWQPRAALGDLFFALLGAVSQLAGPTPGQVESTIALLFKLRGRYSEEVMTSDNPAKQLAVALLGRMPLIVGATPTTEAVALRFKCQLNENAKQTALLATLPEMTHNDIVNLAAFPHAEVHAVVLEDAEDSDFVSRQRAITLEILKPQLGAITALGGLGDSLLARQLSLIYLSDYSSVYLAFLKGVDPTPVGAIVQLKQRLKSVLEGVPS